LVPLDGSPVAASVVPYAKWFAEKLGIPVALLSVVPTTETILRDITPMSTGDDIAPPSSAYPTVGQAEAIGLELEQEARQTLGKEAATLKGEGISVTTEVAAGHPAETILAKAEAVPNTLLAIATHGRSGVSRWVLGSVTDKVVRQSSHPVLVIRGSDSGEGHPSGIESIVASLDGSDLAEASLPLVVVLANALGLPIHLVRAMSLANLGFGLVADGPVDYASMYESIESGAREYLTAVAKRLTDEGVATVEPHLIEESPADAIIDHVGESGNKLVVMASHSRSGFNRWILGSVTDRVVRHSAGPVLVIPSKGT
jgi:nucleotide-binding universal stress UspA family protein